MCACVFEYFFQACLHKVRKPMSILRAKPFWFPVCRSLTLPLEFHTVHSCHCHSWLRSAISALYCSHISDNPGLVLVDYSKRFLWDLEAQLYWYSVLFEMREYILVYQGEKESDIPIYYFTVCCLHPFFLHRSSLPLIPADIFHFFLNIPSSQLRDDMRNDRSVCKGRWLHLTSKETNQRRCVVCIIIFLIYYQSRSLSA